jgi:acetyl-CoA synthetase/medium-chain acyl-CoA synthetase
MAVRERCPDLRHVITFDQAAEGCLSYADVVRDAPDDLKAADTASADPAFMIYTSGTTGEPKGVEHAHRWIMATGEPITKVLMRLTPSDVTFSPLEVSFIYALGCNFLYPYYAGASIAMTPGRFDPERTLAAIEKLRPTILIAVPTLFRRLFALGEKLGRYNLRSLRMGMSSGEPLPDDTLRQANELLGIEIYDCLGQTEIHIFMNPDPKKAGSLGKPLPGHFVTILNDDGKEAGANEVGHLVIRADDPGLSLGYRKKPEIWNQTQRNGWYYTKDLALRDEEGYFWYVSRSDDLIKSRAYLISPREVESALMEHPAVLEAGVIGAPDEMIGQRVKAFVILRPGHQPSEDLKEQLANHVRERIAFFKVPKEIVFVDSLPRTATGKLMRRELRQLPS